MRGWIGGLKRMWAALVALTRRGRRAGPIVSAPAPVSAKVSPLAAQHLQQLDHPLQVLIEQLDKTFPAPAVKPTSTMNELQYAAGCRVVVEWVKLKQKRGLV